MATWRIGHALLVLTVDGPSAVSQSRESEDGAEAPANDWVIRGGAAARTGIASKSEARDEGEVQRILTKTKRSLPNRTGRGATKIEAAFGLTGEVLGARITARAKAALAAGK